MIRVSRLAIPLFFLVPTVLAGPPKVGEPARSFTLPSTTGSVLSLKDYIGKSNVVLVFYRGYW